MNDAKPYEGVALQLVDPKGRVAIPHDFRDMIEARSGERMVVVGLHPTERCLRAYDVALSTRAEARFLRMEEEGVDPLMILKEREAVFGDVERVPYDPSGRIVLPQFFKDEVGIDGFAFFAAAGSYFNIWAPDVLLATTDPKSVNHRRCKAMMAARKPRA